MMLQQQTTPQNLAHTLIDVTGISTYLGEQCIHHDLDLKIYQGETLAIVGGSGAGKTTLMRAILMLLPITAGTIKIFDYDTATCDESTLQFIRSQWGIMFQQSALFSSLTVLENICFPLFEYTRLSKPTITEIAKLKLGMVGLALDVANKRPAELSGGMKKRVALARAIALDPQLLFLDEPTAGLDPQGASSLDELILSLKSNLELTIVIVTHDLDTLWRITDRVALLGDKRVLQVGSMAELTVSQDPMVQAYFDSPRAHKAARERAK